MNLKYSLIFFQKFDIKFFYALMETNLINYARICARAHTHIQNLLKAGIF